MLATGLIMPRTQEAKAINSMDDTSSCRGNFRRASLTTTESPIKAIQTLARSGRNLFRIYLYPWDNTKELFFYRNYHVSPITSDSLENRSTAAQ